MNKIFNLPPEQLLYSPMVGVYPAKLNLHTPYIKNLAKIFFKILDESKIEYYVFAGSSIGLLRNNKSIPWVDDYDIIIFDKDLNKLEKLLTVFESNLFKTRRIEVRNNFQNRGKSGLPLPMLAGFVIGTPRYQVNGMKTSFFQVDIFLSKVDTNNIVRNNGGWGLYHRKNVEISLVRPPKYHMFDDTKLPFFNNHVKDIEKEYGDVINTSIIHILHGREKVVIHKHWKDSYQDFYDIENKAIDNTKNLISFNNDLEETPELEFLTDTQIQNDNYIEIMKYVCQNYCKLKNKLMKFYNYSNIKFIYDIRFFFPDLKFELNIKSFVNFDSIRFFLDEIDFINIYDKNTFSKIENYFKLITIIKKPEIKLLGETSNEKNLIIENKIQTVDYSMLVNRKNNAIPTKTQPIVKVKLIDDQPEKVEEQVQTVKANKKVNLNKNINLVRGYMAPPIIHPEASKLEEQPVKPPTTRYIASAGTMLKIPPKKEEMQPAQVVKPIKIKKI